MFIKTDFPIFKNIANKTLEVGPGGNYSTISSAINTLLNEFQGYVVGGIKAEIRLKSGFVMQEQILVDGLDLSWMEITSEDVEVTIQRDQLTTVFDPASGLYTSSTYPAFGARRAKLPVIKTLFNMDTSGASNNRIGCAAYDQSHVEFGNGAGIKNADFNLYLDSSSHGIGRESVFTGAIKDNLSLFRSSSGMFRGANLDGAGGRGLSVVQGSKIAADGISAQNCGDHGAYISSSVVHIENSNFSNTTVAACLFVDRGSVVNAPNSSYDNSGGSGVTIFASQVNIAGSTMTNATANGIAANRASVVDAYGCDASNAGGTAGVYAINGSSVEFTTGVATNCARGALADLMSNINCQDADLGGASSRGAFITRCSKGNLGNAFCRKGASDNANDIVIDEGSFIEATGSTGGTSQGTNTLTENGAIFS